jgi:hypothetical protein
MWCDSSTHTLQSNMLLIAQFCVENVVSLAGEVAIAGREFGTGSSSAFLPGGGPLQDLVNLQPAKTLILPDGSRV